MFINKISMFIFSLILMCIIFVIDMFVYNTHVQIPWLTMWQCIALTVGSILAFSVSLHAMLTK